MIYIIDSHAWIEYFLGTEKGLILKKYLKDQSHKFITLECCLAEIIGWCLRENLDYKPYCQIIKLNSLIFSVTIDLWIHAAEIRFLTRKKVKNFGLIDAILVSKQNELKCKVISGDPHFKTLKNVVYLGR
ncbi:MAG: PIN domain-containing protein [Candidatus Woesearchaeota archaeon]